MIRKPQLNGNTENLENKLNLKQLELNSLLEVTEAINANLPESALYRIYHFTLLSNLTISRLALFVLDDEWECKVHYGVDIRGAEDYIQEHILNLSKISPAKGFDGFDMIIPIPHKTSNLAFVFIGGIEKLGTEDTGTLLSFVQTLSSILIVAIENKKLARQQLQQEALRKELEIASQVQNNLFPASLPSGDKLEIKASYLPHRMVGGDYYDYAKLDENNFLFCIADVSGKGIPAALLMSSFQSGLKTLIRRTTDLEDIVREMNFLVKSNSHGDRFITFFCALVDLEHYRISYINAGHNPPFYVEGGKVAELTKGTTVLGAFDELPFIEKGEIDISADAVLFAYTDGLSETSNEEDEEYGTERLKEFLLRTGNNTQKLHEDLISDVENFKGVNQFPDDITILSCAFK